MKKIFTLFLILFCFSSAAFAKKAKLTIPAGSGYVGSLPDVEERFKKTQEEKAQSTFEYEDAFNDKNNLKPAPRDNPAFVNIIMKKDKTSQYVNDLNEIISIIETLQTSVEEKDNIQKFNAKSYFLKENVEYFRDKYKNKAEESYISYRKLMQLNTHVQSVSNLRRESEVYSPYVTAEQSGNVFSQNSINNQLDYLLKEIKTTLVILKEAK